MYHCRTADKHYAMITVYVTCAFIFLILLFVKEKVTKILSIKCTIQFVNTLNKYIFMCGL